MGSWRVLANSAFLGRNASLAQLCRAAGLQRVSVPAVTVGTVMLSSFEFPVSLPGVSSLFRSVSYLDTMVLLGHMNQMGSVVFSAWGGVLG